MGKTKGESSFFFFLNIKNVQALAGRQTEDGKGGRSYNGVFLGGMGKRA